MNILTQNILRSLRRLTTPLTNSNTTQNTHNSKHKDTRQMTKQHTITTLQDMPEDEFELIAFNLSGKVAGRISSNAMSIAGTQVRRAMHLDESDQAGIDDFNDQMNALDQLEAQNEFFSHAGVEPAVNKEEQLKAWLGVRQVMIDRGFKPTPLADNFKWMVEQTIKRNNPTEEMMQELADAGDLSVEQVSKIYKAKASRAIGDTLEVAKHAMTLINGYEPNINETPDGFSDIVSDSITSSKQTAIVRGNDTTEAMTNLLILKSMDV